MDDILKEVMQSIKAIFDLTSRIDERIKFLTQKLNDLEKEVDDTSRLQSISESKSHIESHKLQGIEATIPEIEENIQKLSEELEKLEYRIHSEESYNKMTQNRWKIAFDFTYKTIWVMFVCWLLYKSNLQSLSLP